ncbi:ABC transporter substrate-binding protein [Okibacterium fritillariae]|uniref:ABC transporter substrate-binding protein n=1 Tax=Okibacterium fritillariae TaxID=123320 RepID=UPI0040559270
MFSSRRGRLAVAALAAGAVLSLAACSSGDPLDNSTSGSGSSGSADSITVGAGSFAESEIIAQIYTQALEAEGVTVTFAGQIGQRDVYLKALEDGSIDLIPDYSGNLLQFYDAETTAKTSEEVYAAIGDALPEGIEVLDQAEAQDADSYNVTKDFSEKNGIKSLADLKDYEGTLAIGANPEFADRPYGPKGLTEVYGVPADKLTFTPVSDGGGPLTAKALIDGTVQLADIYSTTPSIKENGFVTLEDPENLILPQNILPLIKSDKASDKVKDVLNKVSAELTTDDLIDLNTLNQGDQKLSPEKVAKDWLTEKGLI